MYADGTVLMSKSRDLQHSGDEFGKGYGGVSWKTEVDKNKVPVMSSHPRANINDWGGIGTTSEILIFRSDGKVLYDGRKKCGNAAKVKCTGQKGA